MSKTARKKGIRLAVCLFSALAVTVLLPGAPSYGSATGAPAPAAAPRPPEDPYKALAAMMLDGDTLDALYEHGASVAAFVAAGAVRDSTGRELFANELVKIRNAVEKALRSVMTRERLEDVVVPVYGKFFDAGEAEALARFYATPAGKKSLKIQGELAKSLAEAGEAAARASKGAFLRVFLEEFQAQTPDENALLAPVGPGR